MSNNVKIKLNKQGMNEFLNSPEIMQELARQANDLVNSVGGGNSYSMNEYHGQSRGVVFIDPMDKKARAHMASTISSWGNTFKTIIKGSSK